MSTLYPWREVENASRNNDYKSVELFVRLTPKSAHNRVQGLYYDSNGKAFLKISITSPPVDGLANKALINFLADKLNCPKSAIDLIRGHTDRYKTLHIASVSLAFLQTKLLP